MKGRLDLTSELLLSVTVSGMVVPCSAVHRNVQTAKNFPESFVSGVCGAIAPHSPSEGFWRGSSVSGCLWIAGFFVTI